MKCYVDFIKSNFPILKKKIYGNYLSYLDNAASTHMPKISIDMMKYYYINMHSNTHRGIYYLSEKVTYEYENTRIKVQHFLNAKFAEECIFVKSTTEAINLVASSYLSMNISFGDEILISLMEHHSNIVPWKLLCDKVGAVLVVFNINLDGSIDFDSFKKLINNKTKFVSIVYVSNTLGTLNPVKKIIDLSHSFNIPVLLDGAQAVSHMFIDVQYLNCDFFVFSSHKMYGPTGLGILYGKKVFLNLMLPYQGGGNMVLSVNFDNIIYKEPPYRFEAGTSPICEVISFGSTLDFLNSIDLFYLYNHEEKLLDYANIKLKKIPGLNILGNCDTKKSIISFFIDYVHPHDIATILNQFGIAVRAGHHCTMPIMNFYNISSSVRVSFGIYNTFEDIDNLYNAMLYIVKMFYKKGY